MTDSAPDSPSNDPRSFLIIEPSEYNLILLVLRRLFLCLLLLFLMGLGALAMWLDTDRRYSGFFLALVAFSGTLAVVRRGTHLHEGETLFADDDEVINAYPTSPNESPKHLTDAYRHQHRVSLAASAQFSELESQVGEASVHQHIARPNGWNQPPPPPYHMACPEPPPAYADIVPNLMDQNTPSTSRQQAALSDVAFHDTYSTADNRNATESAAGDLVYDDSQAELTQVVTADCIPAALHAIMPIIEGSGDVQNPQPACFRPTQ